MAYTRGSATKATRSFIPVQYSTMLLAKLDNVCVALDCVNTEYEGEIQECGDIVTIPELGNIAVNDWTVDGTVTYQTTTESSTDLVIDQQKYWAFKVDYVDEKQASIGVVEGYADRGSIAIRDVIDTFLLTGLANGVPASNTLGGPVAGSVVNITPENISAIFIDMMAQLKSQKVFSVTSQKPWAIVTPQITAAMTKYGALQQTAAGDEARRSGIVGDFMGWEIKETTNLALTAATGGNDDYLQIVGGVNFAYTFAQQITKVEDIMPLQTTFGDAKRALYVYGGKAIRPNALVKAYVKP